MPLILIVDDSPTELHVMQKALENHGYRTAAAADGAEGVRLAREMSPDLIFMDIVMPGMNGYQATRALAKIADHQPDIVFVDIMMPRLDGYQTCSLIKHNKVFRAIPVIMLSSKDGLFDRARGRIVGSEHYLTKPFTKDELLSAIETHIGR